MNECARELEWAGGKHVFNLNQPWVRNTLSTLGLPGEYGSTPAACLKRFEDSVYSLDDIERVIELGLIGGGMKQSDARRLVADHVATKPVAVNTQLAFEVLAALFIGAGKVDE